MTATKTALPVAAERELLTQPYADQIAGTLGCWDRVIITGTLTDVCHAGAVEAWLRRDNLRCFDLKVFAEPLRDQARDHALLTARAAGLTIEHLERKGSARRIASPRSWPCGATRRAWWMCSR